MNSRNRTYDEDLSLRIGAYLKSIAHPIRIQMLFLLDQNPELSVGELCRLTNCEQSLASHHLSNLRQKKMVRMRRDGKNILYRLGDTNVLELLYLMKDLYTPALSEVVN